MQHLQLKISQKGLILVSIPLVFEIIFVIALNVLLAESDANLQRQLDSKDFINDAASVLTQFYEAGRTFLSLVVTKRTLYADRLDAICDRIPITLARLEQQPLEQAQRDRLNVIQQLSTKEMELLHSCARSVRDGEESLLFVASFDLRGRAEYTLTKLVEEVHALVREEIKLHAPQRAAQARKRVQEWITVGLIANVLLALALAIFFSRGVVRRLRVVEQNSQRLANGAPLLPLVSGTDEIGLVDASFHRMAAKLEEATRKERAIIENAVDLICSIDANGAFQRTNPAWTRLLGYQQEELQGIPYTGIVVSEDLAHTKESINETAKSHTPRSFESRLQSKEGKVVHMLWSASWSDAEQMLFCVLHDITARKEIEHAKRQFVAMVSHDLKSPLTAIQTTLNVLSAGVYGELPESGKRVVELAEGNTERLIALVREMLDLERMESGRMELKKQPILLEEIARTAVETVLPLAEKQHISIVLNVGDSPLHADPVRLQQVITNFLSNSLKFSPTGGKIEVRTSADQHTVKLEVVDEGVGVPQEFQGRIFNSFEQVDPERDCARGGSGIGLAICKAIIEEHGGTIGVQSDGVHGSIFWFKLPAK